MEWDDKKNVKFRDPVHGYITVPRIYVAGIIDTPYVQRIKSLSQTGIRPLYPSATHDRFAHSLGVYHFSMLVYENMKKRILENADELHKEKKLLKPKELASIKWDLEYWKVLLSIAALLHDVGHPAYTHSFEFLYDDVLMVFPDDYPKKDDAEDSESKPPCVNMKDKTQYEGWQKIAQKLKEEFDEAKSSYKESLLKKKLQEYYKKRNVDIPIKDISGNPHERMGAYMILNDDNLRNAIKEVIEAYLKYLKHDQPKRYKGIMAKTKEGEIRGEIVEDGIDFICRMITRQTYKPSYMSKFNYNDYRKSAMNCIINILNGKVDVDSIDYTMRNAHTAGYDTHKVDYNRLCLAFSVYLDENENILKPCFASNAISVLGGFISARNTEPTWLYSHHKLIYHDILIKMLFIYSSKYLSYLDAHFNKVKLPLKKKAKIITRPRPHHGNKEKINPINAKEIDSYLDRSYRIYMISPLMPYLGSQITINRSTDASFDTLFKNLSVDLLKDKDIDIKYKRLYESKDNEIFRSLIDEYISRKYKRSLWKSYQEYLVRLKSAVHELGLSSTVANKYMIEGIEKFERIGFTIKHELIDEEKLTDDYKDQFIYVYDSESDKEVDPPQIILNDECFSNRKCVCKIVNVRYKNFDDLKIDFGEGKRSNLGGFPQVISSGNTYKFPYVYVTAPNNDKLEKAKDNFWRSFKTYCQKRLKDEAVISSGEDTILEKTFGYRDVIHGDITLPEKFWNIINTSEFQRLSRIKQLAVTSLYLPTVNHTRYEHSIGACHIMQQVVEHFGKVFNEQNVHPDSIDSDIAVLATLLHDIGHGPFSHVSEHFMDYEHEKWTKRIILDESTELNKAIKKGFGDDAPQRVVDCLNYKDIVKTNSPEKLNFSFIYSALVSGALDVDRIDYLSRDCYYAAVKFGNIDIPKIITAIKLTSIDGKYCLCFDKAYLPYLEQLIIARKEMYSNVYLEPQKILMETLVERILERAYKIGNKLEKPHREILKKLKCPDQMQVNEYLSLDDYTMYGYFKKWHDDKKDEILYALTGSLLKTNLFKPALEVSADGIERNDLLVEIKKKYNLDLGSNRDTHESFAIFPADKHVIIYPDTDIKDDNAKNIIISNQNGEIEDFGKLTYFSSSPLSRHFLFWNENVLYDALIEKNYSEGDAKKMVAQIRQLIESYKPRNHIEIERKYACSQEALKLVKQFLKSDNLNAGKDASFVLDKPFEKKEQIDTYFDTDDHILQEKKCTLRIRQMGNNHVCTVKLPVESKSFGGNSPTARREYESECALDDSSNQSDMTKLLKTQEDFILKRLGSEGITREIFANFKPILDVKNNRDKCIVKKVGSDFKCEVCLDNVTYRRHGEQNGVKDFQIEVELKSDYITHVILNHFTTKLEELMGQKPGMFSHTEQSKLERGLGMLENSRSG
jgi:HD superfamily phosphohydrolase/uncharacterized protein YjbK